MALDEPTESKGDCPDVDELLGFVEKRLTDTAAQAVRAHIERCSDCMEEVSAAMSAAPSEEPAGQTELSAPQIGRFQILEPIGAGGMGKVFSAFDPQLNRRVAIKVLKRSGEAIDEARFVREARALARISHPNVVPVHEAGPHGDSLFIAMEFVEGGTLREWAQDPKRADDGDRAILEVLLQAGRGLEAAHASGLVHRDFKPSNVLVGDDGRVRVVDFGVARAEDSPAPSTTEEVPAETTTLEELELDSPSLTQTGYAIGTPAYMAPEQMKGRVSAASDQFSFCVVAWEVLFGERPFSGTSGRKLLASIKDQSVSRPATARVPPHIEAALRRGLSFDPDDRYPDMSSLLAELERRPPRPAWQRWAIGTGVVASLGAATVGITLAQTWGTGPCSDADAAIARVWNERVRGRVNEAMLKARSGPTTEVAKQVGQHLDSYARDWVATRRESCEATVVRAEVPSEVMNMRLACLEHRKEQLAGAIEQLQSHTFGDIAQAQKRVDALPPVALCHDLEYVQLDPEVWPSIDRARDLLTHAGALRLKGYVAGSQEMASMALERAADFDVPCLQSEIHLALAAARTDLNGYEDALQAVKAAHAARKRCHARAVQSRSPPSQKERVRGAAVGVPPPNTASARQPATPDTVDIERLIAAPESSPGGLSMARWQTRWMKWAVETPQRLFKFKGEGNYCAANQSGDVRFLAGAFSLEETKTEAERTCVVTEGTSLVFPIVTDFHGSFDDAETVEQLRATLECTKGAAGVLEIDGYVIDDIRPFYSESEVFEVHLPEDNAFGVDETTVPGMRLGTSVSAGQYVFLHPLPVGTHTIRLTAVNRCPNAQIVDHVVVVEPRATPADASRLAQPPSTPPTLH